MAYLMGIDLGTSSVKTVIMDSGGNIAGTAQESYRVDIPAPGYAEQDMEQLWEATARTIRNSINKSGIHPQEIRGIGLSGQMHGLVMVDRDMKLIRPAIIWADQRTKRQIEELNSLAGEQVRKKTLNSLSTGFFICSLMWVRDNEPENYNKIYKAFLPKDYIRYKLCGSLGTDSTDASATLAFDTAGRCWAYDLMDKAGLCKEFLPKTAEAYEIAGKTTKECEKITGLYPNTPVVYGGGDSLMYSVGNGIIRPGIISANIGTAGQVSCAVNTPVHDAKFRTNTFCHVKEDLWVLMGGHLNGGIVLNWLKNNFFRNLTYSDFDRLAAGIPAASEGLLFLPYLSGERTPYMNPDAKGIFFGMTLRHGCNHMIRAAMEGVMLSLRLSLEIFRELTIPIQRVIASGGGANSQVWLQMQADIFNTEIYTVCGKEQACTGAAITAGVGVGVYDSFEQACNTVVHYRPEVETPDPERAKVYDEAFERFKLLYSNNKNLFV